MHGRQDHDIFNPDSIALPNEIPPPPSLAELPTRVLHSATVETLIHHTDDLQSRLKVHLRRGAELESRIIELEDRLQELTHQRDSVYAQIEVLKEKDRATSDRSQALETKMTALKLELEHARSETRSLEAHLSVLRTDLNRYSRFHRRIQKWVRPLLNAKSQALKQSLAAGRVLESERENLMSRAQALREDNHHIRNDYETRIAKLKADQNSLVEHYEKQMKTSDQQIADLSTRLNEALLKVSTLDASTAERAKATNEKVYFERKTLELESELESERKRLGQNVQDLAQECSTLRAGLEAVRELKEKVEVERDASERARLKAESQLQGLRAVFKELTDKTDRLESQNAALEKINEELSKKLSQIRAESRVQFNDQSLSKVGFVSLDLDTSNHEEQLAAHKQATEAAKKAEVLLTDLEMRAFGIRPEHLKKNAEKSPIETRDLE